MSVLFFPGDLQDDDTLIKTPSEKSASTNLYLYQVSSMSYREN